ncbi:hypothetical protein AB0885_38590, partial [Streptomyces sp. NPDC005534]|uniref:hypothetical protein n=1 Tax=Streptomyces sp. NPDC005534 TaxID=3155714 RepID=UPI003453E99D
RGDADLLQLDPDRPAAERGEGGLCAVATAQATTQGPRTAFVQPAARSGASARSGLPLLPRHPVRASRRARRGCPT